MIYSIIIIILSLHNRLIYGITCKGEYDTIIYEEVSNYDGLSIPGAFIIKKSIPISLKRKNVDFFVGIVPPTEKLENGRDKDSSWDWSKKSLSDKESIIGKTFENVYSNPEQYHFIQYDTSKGSGALVWSEREQENAIWFIHSSPRYLNQFTEKTYRPAISGKASNFMCLHIKLKNVQKVYDRLMAAGIIIYSQKTRLGKHKVLIKRQPKIKNTQSNPSTQNKAVKLKLLENDPMKLFILSTVLKENVLIFTKSRFDRVSFWRKVSERIGIKELYVKNDLTPPNYIHTLNPICTNRISNILETIFIDKNGHSKSWDIKRELDQTNWAICGKKMDCYCTSDTNNNLADSEKSNGIAVCIFNSNLHKAFKDSIKSLACNGN